MDNLSVLLSIVDIEAQVKKKQLQLLSKKSKHMSLNADDVKNKSTMINSFEIKQLELDIQLLELQIKSIMFVNDISSIDYNM